MIHTRAVQIAPKEGRASYQMIRSIDVRNFRCYRHLHIDDASRLNLVTGDNGSGKTSLLEAIFLALATGSEVAMRLRQQRGLDGIFSAPARRIEESLWGDFFYDYDMRNHVSINLEGDGDESRRVEIARGRSGMTLPLDAEAANVGVLSAPVAFTWTNAAGQEFAVAPKITQGNIELPDTGEDMPNFFLIPSGGMVGSADNASRFSELSKNNAQHSFVKIFTKEFDWISDLSIEVSAGAPVIFATLKGKGKKIPLPNLSSGINRMMAVLLAIACRPRSVVLVDEIENGTYYRHLDAMWRAIIALLRENNSQLFVSTHSAECISALGRAVGKKIDDISLWQTERVEGEHVITQFPGKRLKLAIEYHQDVR